jgi:hypothetical protein
MTAIDDVFNAIFYGSGAPLGLLIIITFLIGIMLAHKYLGIFSFALSGFMALQYITQNMPLYTVVMSFFSVFNIFYLAREFRR